MKKSYTFNTDYHLPAKKSHTAPDQKNIEMDNLVPGKHIIQNLIMYSKSLNIIKSQSIGSFGIICN